MTNKVFESVEFIEKFQAALREYNCAIDNSIEPISAAQEFMQMMFNDDIDEALEYQALLENIDDNNTAQKLKDIVINSATFSF